MGTSMPPPPTDTPIRGSGSGSTGDTVKDFFTHLTGGGMPMVRQQLDEAHQKRQAEADRNHRSYAELSQVLAGDTTGKYMAKDGTLTPEGQKLELQRKAAFDAWNKAAGVSKEGKSVIGRLGQLTDRLVHHRAGGQPPQAASGMPQPPQAAASTGQGGGSPTSGMPAPPSVAPEQAPALPPPPGYMPAGMGPDTLAARSQADTADARGLAKFKAEHQAEADIKGDEPKRMVDGLVKAGFTEDEAKKIVQSRLSGAAGRTRPHPVTYTDPNDPTRKLFGTQDLTTGQVFDQSGEPVANAGQVQASMLPTARTGEMPVFNPVTNQFEQQPTYSSSQKVAPKAKGATSKMPTPPSDGKGGSASAPAAGSGGRHGVPARNFSILQKQATSVDEARNSLIGDDPNQVGGLAQDLSVFKRPESVKRLSNYLGLVTSTVENEAKQVTGQGPMAAAEWYLELPQTVVGLQQGVLADASRSLDDGAPDGPEHRFVADYFRTIGTIGGLRASTGASAARWSFNTLRSELPTPGPVTSYPEAMRRIKNIVQETNVVAKRNPLASKADVSKLDDVDAIFAKDPQGKLHKAKAGTPLPKGWTLSAPASQ